jgi:hypothetical protein
MFTRGSWTRVLYTMELQKVSTILECFHYMIFNTAEARSQIMTCRGCDSVVACLYRVILAQNGCCATDVHRDEHHALYCIFCGLKRTEGQKPITNYCPSLLEHAPCFALLWMQIVIPTCMH